MKKKAIFILILLVIAVCVYWIMHVFTDNDTPPKSNTVVISYNMITNTHF